jgi:hypothetical protein
MARKKSPAQLNREIAQAMTKREDALPTEDEAADWRYEVANGDTTQGLIEWVTARREMLAER